MALKATIYRWTITITKRPFLLSLKLSTRRINNIESRERVFPFIIIHLSVTIDNMLHFSCHRFSRVRRDRSKVEAEHS